MDSKYLAEVAIGFVLCLFLVGIFVGRDLILGRDASSYDSKGHASSDDIGSITQNPRWPYGNNSHAVGAPGDWSGFLYP
jgi:hypothetical protein